MKYLVLTHQNRSINIDAALDVLAAAPDTEVHRLTRRQIKHLRWTLWRLRASRFDGVLLDLPFKYLHPRAAALRSLQRVLIYEEDACQDRIPASRWHGRFTRFYRQVPGVIVLATGFTTADHLAAQGVDARFAPKGYDQRHLRDDPDSPRRIRLGFIGRTGSSVYHGRKNMLERAQAELGCELLRTESSEEYRRAMQAIRFFFSADVGLGEYMAKNFEALACGCILVAWRQGDDEEARLGLVDGENCLLYSSIGEAAEKIAALEAMPEKMLAIREAGVRLAREHYSHAALGEILLQALRAS